MIKNQYTASKTDIKRLQDMKDHEIDTSDIHTLTDEELSHAVKVDFSSVSTKKAFMKNPKEFLMEQKKKKSVSIRLDEEIIKFFKTHTSGKGYQTAINSVLKQYVHSHQ
jgi:uncharacterized protein (DUF4415 family)